MKIIELIRSLSLKERTILANEINRSLAHLNGLDGIKRKPTILTVYKIYKSDFNRSLPKSRKFNKQDFEDFVNQDMEEKA